MAKPRFSLELQDEIVKEYAAGETLREIAKKHDTSHSVIQRIVENKGEMRGQNGVDPSRKRRKTGSIMAMGPQLRRAYDADPRVTVYTLAARYDCSISAIHRSLIAAGTDMRQSGGDRRSKRTRGLLGWLDS
jgi:transposase